MHSVIQVVRVTVKVTCPRLPNDQKRMWRCGQSWESGTTREAEFLVVPNSNVAPAGCVSERAFRGLLEETRIAVLILDRELTQHTVVEEQPKLREGLFDDILPQTQAKASKSSQK